MLKTYSLHNELMMKRWDAFVERHPRATPFHLSSWIRSIFACYRFKPLLWISENSSGQLCGVFPCFVVGTPLGASRVVSLPFSDYGGPLFNDENEERDVVAGLLGQKRRRVNHLEIRSSVPQIGQLVYHDYYKRHVLELSEDLDSMKKHIDKRTIQYSIRKSKRAGVEIIEDNTLRGLDEFHRLNILTRRKHGVPSQPRKFFEGVFHHMMPNGRGSILLAVSDSRVIAASVFLKLQETVYYKYNASDPQFLSKKTPNHLLTWHAIEAACRAGYRYFDFGRTSPDNEGLMRYKAMWDAKCIDLPYSYYPKVKGLTSKQETSLTYRTLTRLWRLVPDGLAERIGPLLYRHLG